MIAACIAEGTLSGKHLRNRPEQMHDLPGGAGRLVQRAAGYVATFVGGVQTIDRDERTGELPGRLVRGAR